MLRYDPYAVFTGSRTPAGVYARQKWRGEQGWPEWRRDFEATVAGLRAGQDPDGSWEGAVIPTVHGLFGLHLTVRAADAAIARGLDWLLARCEAPPPNAAGSACGDSALAALPFAPAPEDNLLTGASLFLASIFGRARDARVLSLYARAAAGSLCFCDNPLAANNLLRALVVHPDFARSPVVEDLVAELAASQRPEGDWPAPLPFYQTVNALAHLQGDLVSAILDKACGRLAATQNPDGTWGVSQPEWHTFLAVHALRNRGRI